jgi:hypothetical protein
MASFKGGTQVKAGYYWNPKAWSVEVIPPEGGRLPAAAASYLKLPFPLLFLVVPVLGALFLMFLPLIGFALFFQAIVKKVTGGVKEGAADLAATLQPGWQPGEAHFTGKPGEEGAPGEKADAAAPTRELEALEKEIEAKRTGKS